MYCTLAGAACIGAGVLFWIVNDDKYDEEGASAARDRTAVPLTAIGILLCLAGSVPLAVMGCCTLPPLTVDDIGEFESSIPSDPRSSMKGSKMKGACSSVGTARTTIPVAAPSSFASAPSSSRAGRPAAASAHEPRTPSAHGAMPSNMRSACSAGAFSDTAGARGSASSTHAVHATYAAAQQLQLSTRLHGRVHSAAEYAV